MPIESNPSAPKTTSQRAANLCDPYDTRSVLSYRAVADSVEKILHAKAGGTAYAPERLHLPLANGGVLLLMPATDERLTVTKLITVHPQNASFGRPSVRGEVVVIETRTGERLAMRDGATVTAVRTATVSAVAARWLAPDPSGEMLLFGAGVQAKAHLEAFAEIHGTRCVHICSQSSSRAESLCEYGRGLGMRVDVVEDAREVLPQVRLIIAATTSRTPVVAEEVVSGTFVVAVGAYTAEMAELSPQLVRRATNPDSILVVDTFEGARHEAGDLIQANIDWDRVRSLESVQYARSQVEDVAVFKSVGHAL